MDIVLEEEQVEKEFLDVKDLLELHPEWQIEVRHYRWYRTNIGIAFMTKGDAFRSMQFKEFRINPKQPLTKGGATFIKIWTPEGVFVGNSHCLAGVDSFNKKEGRKFALEKIYKRWELNNLYKDITEAQEEVAS